MVTRHQALRTRRAAGLVGIIFALLLGTAIILVRLTLPGPDDVGGDWFSDASRRRTVQTALGLIPFAGIFFLWFMGAVRARMGDAEDKFVATVFLGSGLLFVATLFGAAASAGSLLAAAGVSGSGSGPQLQSFGQHFTYGLLTTYSMRMAAVFSLTTSSIGRQLGILPRWLSILGYLVGLTLLFVTDSIAWSELVFPAWALIVSLHILVAGLRGRSRPAPSS
ncbi:hypothetical protein FBY35_0401 [Streptomyces sp. SLBN-118]|uniref:hypothetical protein n=1 Tax=Streptomyces sp. SLBN-118 TaxID=2768454 RepID=UPI001152EF57|nr:hypothetical protein [Streptomyces sp. SLBN-118]TQK50093.1 hypothetical protein FBY35_0401 [Streptomyces sp. SLBN-118]